MDRFTLIIAGLLVCASVVTGACRQSSPAPETTATSAAAAPGERVVDIHSFARPEEARVTHVALDLRTDFTAKRLVGSVRLAIARAPDSKAVVLDTQDLEILAVADEQGRPLTFVLGEVDRVRGRALEVTLPADVRDVVVQYQTSPSAGALQWLAPPQTAGKRRGYLFSQGQAILTRSWIPTQDSPGIRQTYTARITVPADLRAVMSAEALTPDGVAVPDGRSFEFRMTQPIPPYLIALAVGDINFRPLGARTGVYAEPSVLAAAAEEFADMERMVAAAETLLGPYAWGRYDVLVLPPSFPFGGMENPRLTFATPTILAGDRSLVSLIAHELAHSWSGNLVTNATWSDFWLNEGVTSYVERRIMEAIYGRERADMLDVLAHRELLEEIARLGGPTSPETVLHLDLAGRNPDEGATSVPYDKGAAVLRMMEEIVGRPRFDAWLSGYLSRHAFQSITTATFLDDVRTHLIKGDRALEQRLRLDEWIDQPGLPDNIVVPRSTALARVDEAAASFATGAAASSLTVAQSWSTQEWQHFLAALPATLTQAQLADLDAAFALTARQNSEVLFAWLRIAIRHRYAPALPALERFLTVQGRRKFLRPLYEDLMGQEWGRPLAKRIYARARPLYHPVATTTIDQIVR